MSQYYKLKGLFRSSLARRIGGLGPIAMLACGMLCSSLIQQSAGQEKVPPRTRPKQQQQQTEAEQRADLPKIVSVRGQGGKTVDVRSREKQTAVPPPLSAEVKNSLIKSAGVKETRSRDSFTLTPAKPYQSQGSLAFEEIQYLDPEGNQLTVGNQDSAFDEARTNKAVFLFVKTAAGKKYLIDFTVTGEKFFVSISPGNTKETFSGTHHVLIVYEATSSELEINLTGKGSSGAVVWTLHSCEVTPLS